MSLPTTIVSLDGSCSSVDICSDSTVDDIKEICSEEKGLDATLFDLTYEGDILTGRMKVLDYGIQFGCELEMVRSQRAIALEKLGTAEMTAANFFDEVIDGGELVPYFLDAGMPINVCDESEYTALHILSLSGRVSSTTRHYTPVEVAEILISRGADISSRCKYLQNTPLHVATDVEVARLLIKCGSPIDAQNFCGDTPLHAHLYKSSDICKILIEAGASLNIGNMFSQTAVHVISGFRNPLPSKKVLE